MKDMKPVSFAQANITYHPPASATGIAPLPAYRDGQFAVSCWNVPLAARIKLLFTGRVWLSAMAAEHPPVKLSVNVPFTPAPAQVKATP